MTHGIAPVVRLWREVIKQALLGIATAVAMALIVGILVYGKPLRSGAQAKAACETTTNHAAMPCGKH